MPRKPSIPVEDRTPQARLSEGAMHGVVGYQLAQATIVTDQVYDERAAGTGLRRVEYTMLALVQANPGVTARQLAKALAVTPPNIALWLEKLESRGLLRRTRSEADARMQHIEISAEGRRLLDRATRAVLEGEAAALAVLSAAERAMLVELLHKIALSRRR